MKRIRMLLTTLTIFLATISYAGIEPTSGRYIESNTDLSIKVIGGQLTWSRDYRDRQWRFNRAWESLIFTYDVGSGNVESIQRANDPYKKLDSAGTVFRYGKRSTIRKQADGTWLWKDRDGNSTSYDANGKTLRMDSKGGAFITLMYNGDNKLSGAKDVHGTQALWIEYDLVTGKVSKAKDYGNREVLYTWEAVNNTTSPIRYKLTNVKDARGYDWQYAYAAAVARDGRVDINSRIDPEGRVVAVAYGGSGRANGVTNALGHTTNYTFDYIKSRKEFYLKTSYPGGRVTETWYERDGEVKRRDINGINIITITEDLRKDIETDTFGRVTTKEYDEFKNLIKTIYPDGTSTSTTYDLTNSNVLTRTDERGTVTQYEYWPKGRLKKMIEALGTSVERSTEYTYDQYGQMLTKTQVGDAVTETAFTQYSFDGFGNVSKIIDAELNEVQYTSYDSQGNNLVMIDGRGNSWTYGYDGLGNQSSDKNPLNEETINEYDKVGNLIKMTYPDTNFVQFEYDNQDRMIKRIDELTYFTTTTYDQAGNRIAETDKAGRTTQYRYDLLNRSSEIEDATGNIIKYTYPDPNNNLNQGSIYQPVSVLFPTYTQSFKYDLRNRVFEESKNYQTSSNQVKIEVQKTKYDVVGNRIESIDAENRISKAEYDQLNRYSKSIDPLLQQTNFTYDKRNNLLTLTDALNQTHTFSYDKINQKVTKTRPLGQTGTYTYNANYLAATKVDAKGQKTEIIYDSANRNTQTKYYKTGNILDKTVIFTYNNRGNLSNYDDGTTQGIYTYDNAQQKLTEAIHYGIENFSFTYTYHPDGQKASYTGLDSITYSYFYNNLGILNNVVIPNEGNISYQNFNWNRPQRINYPGNIIRAVQYDGLQRINTINVKDASNQTLMDYDYTYTPSGNITNKNTEHGNYTYGYDNLDRLTNADYPTLTDEIFTYDALSNRITDSITGVTAWLYNQNNQLLNSVNNQYTYDSNGSQVEEKDVSGQLLKQYIYNTENRLTEIKDENGANIASYYYDPFSRRLSKTIINTDSSTTTTYFHYNDEGYSAEKTNGQIISYLFSPQNVWSTDPIFKRENNNFYYYQNDHLGTPNILHDKQGQVVNAREMKAFGEWINSTNIIKNNFAFAGQLKDSESNNYFNLHRYYLTNTGRYNKSDPLSMLSVFYYHQNAFTVGIEIPRFSDLNGYHHNYLYTLQNPIGLIDSLGLDARVCCKKIPGLGPARHCYVELDSGNTYGLQGGKIAGIGWRKGQKFINHGFDQGGDCGPWEENTCEEDIDECVQKQYNQYTDPSHYKAVRGPNSNSFAGTIARACGLKKGKGWAPGWNKPPAPPYKGNK